MTIVNGNSNGHASSGDAKLRQILSKERFEKIQAAKLLVVGAGGIGCELLKNLVLTGFKDIEVIDLDTIDVSNLNRQFLFRRAHVDRPKAEVAADAVRQFRPGVKIVAHHGNIKDAKYGVEYISHFDAVVNALDNLEARRHVNRLCLAAEKPLLEAGSTGHLGQVTVIKKGETECFECQSKPTQKVYPYCTIRSTPEKPIHCLVWAKNLFDLCFGPEDESNLLSDLAAEMKGCHVEGEKADGMAIGRKIYTHLFEEDIRKQAALEDLWSDKRPPPTPLPFEEACKMNSAPASAQATQGGEDLLATQRLPSVSGDAEGFVAAIAKMYGPERLATVGQSVFSKDDPIAMDFVHCAANMRMENYRIARLSRWDAQSIAGAIIPAVASTNAIVAG
jgi:ubiquitin-like 1-activating enzyme E1 B